MLNGLDLFSGIGGIADALAPWVRPVAYCEIDEYAQSVLVSEMGALKLPVAPIWDDVRTLNKKSLWGDNACDRSAPFVGLGPNVRNEIDIITAGFPCQDISIAGTGVGLEGKRSGLFFEIVRLCRELQPPFVFLENVSAITSRGGRKVVGSFTQLGYDCRWCVISAASVGANHLRRRWFCLAYAKGIGWGKGCEDGDRINTTSGGVGDGEFVGSGGGILEDFPNAKSQGLPYRRQNQGQHASDQEKQTWSHLSGPERCGGSWWTVEPGVGRVAHGIPHRVDRIKALGNAVVPLQARTAFEILTGIGKKGAPTNGS